MLDYSQTPTANLNGMRHIVRKRIGSGRYRGVELAGLYNVLAAIDAELDKRGE